MLRVRFWGTRGSIPTPGPATARYGGNTPCVEVRTPRGDTMILDAGTGIRALGQHMLSNGSREGLNVDLLLTHTHWDHVQGLPFFEPLYEPTTTMRIWGARDLVARVERVLSGQMTPGVFPVSFEAVRERLEFREITDRGAMVNDVEVLPLPVHHPDGAIGYALRPENGDGAISLAYVPDNEIGYSTDPAQSAVREALVKRLRGARLLVHDSMYTASEASNRNGWGHSTIDDAVALAVEAGVETLVLFHHSPTRTDDELTLLVDVWRDRLASSGAATNIVAAEEGMVLEVG